MIKKFSFVFILLFTAIIFMSTNVFSDDIFMVSAEGQVKLLQDLIKKGESVNKKDNDGTTPLMYAANKGKVDVMQLLIKNKANVNEQNNDGNTPLMFAAASGNLEAVTFNKT